MMDLLKSNFAYRFSYTLELIFVGNSFIFLLLVFPKKLRNSGILVSVLKEDKGSSVKTEVRQHVRIPDS